MNKTVYCSLDLEMSGFDPATDEILEIGFVFFTLGANGVEIVEQWTQVFRPTQPVHPKILGLTGISQAELEAAPLIAEHKDFLQDKLGEAVILGHSIKVDISFLEQAGLQLRGGSVDTLELAQFILPTQHSYNLENLIHTFGLVAKDAHEDPSSRSHRALADAKATMLLLEKLLCIYQSFPVQLRQHIERLVDATSLSWKDLLQLPLAPFNYVSPAGEATLPEPRQDLVEALAPRTIITPPVGQIKPVDVAAALQSSPQPVTWIVPDKTTVIKLWKQGLAQAIFKPEEYLDEQKLAFLIGRQDLTEEEIRFLIKILVWKATNWQSRSLVDLNLSFFGGQFRQLVACEVMPELEESPIYICEYQTFFDLPQASLKDRLIVVDHMGEFEYALTKTLARRASWGFLNYALKSVYNPESNLGQALFKEEVIGLLAAGDLFFGLVRLLVAPLIKQSMFIDEQTLTRDDYIYKRIEQAAEHLMVKLEVFAEKSGSEHLLTFLTNLSTFFRPVQDGIAGPVVKWLEVRDDYCAFMTQPLEIKPVVHQTLEEPSAGVVFIDPSLNKQIQSYFAARLGLTDYRRVVLPGSKLPIPTLTVAAEGADMASLADLLSKVALPAIVAMPSLAAIKEFYRQYHEQLNGFGTIYAQGYSGGSNKIMRNFGLRQQSMLLVTHEFLSNAPAGLLKPATLIFYGFPEQNLHHPYAQALESYQHNQALSFATTRALYILEQLINRVYQDQLRAVHVITLNAEETTSIDYLLQHPLFAR